jgi:hypothetical protein
MKCYFIICVFIVCKLNAFLDTRLRDRAPGFHHFENLYFDTLHRTCFSLGKSVDIAKIMEKEKGLSFKWKNHFQLTFGENAFDPIQGLTLVLLQSSDLSMHQWNFSLFIDQIIGLWNLCGEKKREEVHFVLIDGNSDVASSAWRSFNALQIQLINVLFPHAQIRLIEELAPSKPLRFYEVWIADSSVSKKKNHFFLSQEKMERLVSCFYTHYGIAPHKSEKIAVTYVRRYFPRQLHTDLEQELLRRIKEIPDVAVRVVNFPFHSFKERIALAARTDILLGVHDSALSHAVFLLQGSLLIELFPEGVLRSEYRMLAEQRNVHYLCMNSGKGWCQELSYQETGSEQQLQAMVTEIDMDAIVSAIRNYRRSSF